MAAPAPIGAGVDAALRLIREAEMCVQLEGTHGCGTEPPSAAAFRCAVGRSDVAGDGPSVSRRGARGLKSPRAAPLKVA